MKELNIKWEEIYDRLDEIMSLKECMYGSFFGLSPAAKIVAGITRNPVTNIEDASVLLDMFFNDERYVKMRAKYPYKVYVYLFDDFDGTIVKFPWKD